MEIRLELLTNTNGRKGTRDEICHTIHRYAKANNKYMKDYHKNKELSYLMYWDANNLYGWSMSQKLSVDNFEWEKNISKFDESCIKNYNENSDKGYILEADVEYSKLLHDSHNDLTFLPERMKIKKCRKLVFKFYNKEKYIAYSRTLKQALNHGLVMKKVLRIMKFYQKACLKPYIDINTSE